MHTDSPFLTDLPLVMHSPYTSPPLSPPRLNHAGSPYERIPLPPVHDQCDQYHTTLSSIHPILCFSPKSAMWFDLHRCPSMVTLLPDHRPLSHDTLAEPATDPPLPCISITTPLLPWSITVLSSQPHLPNAFVTVSDVLHTLHLSLSLTATLEEYSELSSDDIRSRAKAACERRIRAHPDWRTRAAERRMGMRRIDLFMGRTRFMGLSITGRRRDILVLSVY